MHKRPNPSSRSNIFNYPIAGVMFIRALGVVILVAASILPVHSQLEIPVETNESWFDKMIGIENSGIINGPEYRVGMLGASTHPFFGVGESLGSIRYNDQLFRVLLLYDIHQDIIAVKHLGTSGRQWLIELDKPLVTEFVISGRLFRNIGNGFHEVLFDVPDFMIVSKRSKILQLTKRIFNYLEYDRFYIVQSNHWQPLWNKSALIEMLTTKEDKKELKLFIRDNHIRVRKFRSEDLVKIATFINARQHSSQ